MWILIAGLVVFLGVHSVRMVAPGWREAQLAASPGRWKGLYSLVSFVGLALIIWGWIVFRPEAPDVYYPPDWGRHAAYGLVLLGFIGFVAAYAPAGWIKTRLQHPMVTGLILWALGHLLANGDLASVLLFGAFLVYAVINRIAVTFRPPPAAVTPRLMGDVIAVVGGLAAYLVFGFWLHPLLIGVSPFG